MKQLLTLILLSLCALPADAAISQLQKRESEATVSTMPMTLVYSSSVTSGSLLIAVIRMGNQSLTGITVSDNVNAGNWSQAFLANDSANGRWLGIFYKENSSAGTITVSLTSSSASDSTPKALNILEYSGIATSSSLDTQNSSVSASTTTPASGNITTSNASDLIIGVLTFSTGATTTVSVEASGFTQQQDDTIGTAAHDHCHVADQIVSSTGTYSYAPTLSTAQVTTIGVAAFKASGAATTPKKPPVVI